VSLERIAATLRETAGLEADALGARHLAEAVDRLQARSGLGADAYATRLAGDAGVRELLIAELLVHETSFFRYPASFHHLAAHAVARAASRPGPVRVLCAACATGQEAYSVAIALLEAGLPPERVSVDAFDRSAAAIEAAREGCFGRGGTRGLERERAARWFEERDGTLTVLPAVRALVRFESGSLLDDDRPFARATYDAVMCRNLLIYLTADARRRALATVRTALAPGGVLYLGHAEVLVARAEGFAPAGGSATYACLPSPPETARAAPPGPRAPRRPDAAVGVLRAPTPSRPAPSVVATVVPVPALARKADVLQTVRDLADAGRLEEACALLEAEMARGRPGADHFHLLALVRRAAGKAREADEALGRALYLDPSHPGALLLAAVAAEGRGERNVAARLHARARAAVEGKG